MHKILLLLGMLLRKPLYGYELHRIVSSHGELYADLKKANLYYLLEKLAKEGYLLAHAESSTRGARGERFRYEITDQGRAKFQELLREIMLSYEPVHTGVGTAVVFLATLSQTESLHLFAERHEMIMKRREVVAASLGDLSGASPLVRIAGDHLLCLIDAELAWIDRSVALLRAHGWESDSQKHNQQIIE